MAIAQDILPETPSVLMGYVAPSPAIAFDTNPFGFSALNAAAMLGFSSLIYKHGKGADAMQDMLAQAGFTCRHLDNGDGGKALCHGLIATRGNEMVITFRGADTRRIEEFQDAGVWGLDPKKGIEHKFDKILNHQNEHSPSLMQQVEDEVANFYLNHPNAKIFLTGHSRGGALAQITAGQLLQKTPALAQNIAGLYTFGQPRTANEAFVKALDAHLPDKYFRVNRLMDFAVFVPFPNPTSDCVGFTHGGTAVTMFPGGQYTVHGAIQNKNVQAFKPGSVVTSMLGGRGVEGVKDLFKNHWIPQYLKPMIQMVGIGENKSLLKAVGPREQAIVKSALTADLEAVR